MKTVFSLKMSLLPAFLLMLAFPVMAQDTENNDIKQQPKYFIAPRADFSWYGRDNPTMGSGLSAGFDTKLAAFGFNAAYMIPVGNETGKRIDAVEVTVFAREYFGRLSGKSSETIGPFFQYNLGLIIFGFEDEMFESFDVVTGCFGLSLGWRIPFGRNFYVEPAVRLGHPYGFVGELAIGVRL